MKGKPKELWKLFRRFRDDNGWDQITLAKKAGCSQAYISEIERGEKIPDFRLLVAIIKAFDLTWLQKHEFLSKSLKDSNGNMAFQINNGIIPDDMLCDFLGHYLAADYISNKDGIEKIDALLKITERIKESLEQKKEKISALNYNEGQWDDPLSLPHKK
jgi:transcriptional regulator with XRE-family HTH domain